MTLTPKTSFLLFVVFVAAASVVVGGCRNDDATNFYANMGARGVGKH